MERGESSRAAYRRGLEAEKVFLRFEDIESEETWERVTERPKKGAKKQPETKSEIYGYQSAGFESVLRRGWLAERRKMEHGRIYMYYYDQSGKQYTRLKKAKEAMELEAARVE